MDTKHLIQFEPVTQAHQGIIFVWLQEPHMVEFWDNSQEHKDDIVNFIEGRKTPSNYFNGQFSYWIGTLDGVPYCFILTCPVLKDETLPASWEPHLPVNGSSYGIDFGIGNKKMLGKGLASPTLIAFTDFFRREVDPLAKVFMIDPDVNNPRAVHVYGKAGFERVATFEPTRGVFVGQSSLLMVKRYR